MTEDSFEKVNKGLKETAEGLKETAELQKMLRKELRKLQKKLQILTLIWVQTKKRKKEIIMKPEVRNR